MGSATGTIGRSTSLPLADSPLGRTIATTPTDVWNDSCSVSELEYAISYGAVGATANPTIVTDVASGTRLVEEEQFGPVLPVVTYDDLETVVSAVNAGMYGLDASIWGEDVDAIRQLGPRLDAGTIWMNTHGQRGADQPFGGMKWSGIGVENGELGLDDLTELQVLFEARG